MAALALARAAPRLLPEKADHVGCSRPISRQQSFRLPDLMMQARVALLAHTSRVNGHDMCRAPFACEAHGRYDMRGDGERG